MRAEGTNDRLPRLSVNIVADSCQSRGKCACSDVVIKRSARSVLWVTLNRLIR